MKALGLKSGEGFRVGCDSGRFAAWWKRLEAKQGNYPFAGIGTETRPLVVARDRLNCGITSRDAHQIWRDVSSDKQRK